MAILIMVDDKQVPQWVKELSKDVIHIDPNAFDPHSNKYEVEKPESILNPDNPNNIFVKDELYYVCGGYELFSYMRHLGNSRWEYNLGNNDFYWNSAVNESRCVYCNKARFFFIASNCGEDYYIRRKAILDNEDLDSYPTIGESRYVDMSMVKPYFDYYRQLIKSGKIDALGFDFETNGFPEEDDFFITGFSLSCQQLSVWFDYRYPMDCSEEVKKAAYSEFKKFLDEFDVYLWTYNVSFETFVCARLFDKRYEFQDARALFVCDGLNWGSLKLNAMKLLNIKGWVENKDAFIGQSCALFNVYNTYEDFKNADPATYSDEVKFAVTKLNEYGADWKLFEKYWKYQWAVVPTKTLGFYCCLDSYYTLKSAEKLLPKYYHSYRTYLNNARLGAELKYTGVRINMDILEKTSRNMIHLMNMSTIFMDQVFLYHQLEKSSRKNKGFEFTSRFVRGIERHGMGVLDRNIGKWKFWDFNKDDKLTYMEEVADRWFDGNEEFMNRMKDCLGPFSGWLEIGKVSRRRRLIQDIGWIIREYHEVDKNIEMYNKQFNINDDFRKLTDYLNSYKDRTIDEVFGDKKTLINWDRYGEFYDYAVSLSQIGLSELEHCKQFVTCEGNYEIHEIIDLIRNHSEEVDFHHRQTINEDEWIHYDNFQDKLADAIKLDPKNRDQFNKLFGNFYDEAQSVIHRLEMDKYDSIEHLKITDRPEYITFGNEKVKLEGFGGRLANYNAPDMKNEMGNIIWEDYGPECTIYDMQGEQWHDLRYIETDPNDFYKDFPIQNKDEVKYDENGRLSKVKLTLDYDLHRKYWDEIPCYRDHVRRHMCWYKSVGDYLVTYGVNKVWDYGYEPNKLYINFHYYKRPLDRFFALMMFYFIWSGMFKEYRGYITGPRQGIYNRMRGISEYRSFYEIRTNDPKKVKYYSYFPDWKINEKDTKRWASGYRIAT